ADDATNDDTINFSDNEETESSSPQWLLYNAVKDTPHSEPFMRLPSRRFYPDYYKEIKHPISLSQIGNRIKVGFSSLATSIAISHLSLLSADLLLCQHHRAGGRAHSGVRQCHDLQPARFEDLQGCGQAEEDSADEGERDHQRVQGCRRRR